MTALTQKMPPGCTPGAVGTRPSGKPGPTMKILAHLTGSLRHRHFTRSLRPSREDLLAEIWAEVNALWDRAAELSEGQDALDRGLIDAGLDAARANARTDEVFKVMQELREQAGSEEPSYEISDADLRDANAMPHGHPESLVAELDPADEGELAAYASEMWPADEYAEIVAEDYRQRNGGTS
jgi:hypothetical protein